MRRTSGILLTVLLGLVLLAPAARADPVASVSDLTPLPGQVVTVSASGLKPGGVANIDYLGDLVRLASVTVGADGSFVQDVQIPANTKDGPKQIVVTGIAANGRYAYLATNLVMKGPAASARLGDTTLVPGQLLRVDGSRFLAGTEVSIVIFPEKQYLGRPHAGSDGRFATDVRMPTELLNGPHTIVAAGLTAGGGYAYLKLSASVTGGRGRVPAGDLGAGSGTLPPLNPAVVPSSTTSTTRARPAGGTLPPLGDVGDGGSRAGTVLLVVGFLALLALVAGTWFASPDGRRWRRERARQRRHRERARRRRRSVG